MWVLFGFFLLSQLDGLGAVGIGFVELVFFFFLRHVTHSPPLPLEISRECPWRCWFVSNLQKSRGAGRGGVAKGGRGDCAPESEADRVSLVMLLSPWRWLERRGGGGGEDILGRVGADATS